MKRVIALFCTVFVLVVNGEAQSYRIGAYAHPQANFLGKKSPVKGKGFTMGGGVFFEHNIFDAFTYALGLGYTQCNNTYTSEDTTENGTNKLGFVSLPITITYNFYATDIFKVGLHTGIGINYLVSGKQIIDGNEEIMNLSELKFEKKLYFMVTIGISATYLFTEKIGISLIPTFSYFSVFNPATTRYLGVGGQIRFFYEFGY